MNKQVAWWVEHATGAIPFPHKDYLIQLILR